MNSQHLIWRDQISNGGRGNASPVESNGAAAMATADDLLCIQDASSAANVLDTLALRVQASAADDGELAGAVDRLSHLIDDGFADIELVQYANEFIRNALIYWANRPLDPK